MRIIVNGQEETGPPCTVAELVARKRLNAGALVVELNQIIIKQEQWQTTQLKTDDKIELLSFVGGG